MSARRFAPAALGLSAAVVVWALHFTALYGGTALACARGMPQVVLPAITGATLAAAVALAVIAVRGWSRRAVFEHWLSAALAAVALLAVLWEALPVLVVPPCG
jgi:hypothetical protein